MIRSSIRGLSTIMSALKNVDIDPQGDFKYILIRIKEANMGQKLIVRGYAECAYHADIDDKVDLEIKHLKLEGVAKKVLGGGRIRHDPAAKTITVYSYSQCFGKADHKLAVNVLKTVYSDYAISFTDSEQI